jgi:AcrR family transcriptional regulator
MTFSQIATKNIVTRAREENSRRAPTQARARQKYQAILDACRQILSEEGFERTTTAKVAARAGVGKGVLYQYFPNREVLVATTVEVEFERLLTRAIAAHNAPAPSERPLETARRLLRMNVEFWLDNRKLMRVILSEVPGVFDLPGVRRVEDRLVQFMTSLKGLARPDHPPADLDRKLYVLTNLITGFLLRLALADPGEGTADEFTDDLMAVLRGYLRRLA